MKTSKDTGLTWQRALPWILLIGGTIGLIASFALTYDKLQVLQDPGYQPSCNLNPVLSCGSVMKTEQASLFGVPNSVFGLIMFAMTTLLGLVLLASAALKRWLWLGAQTMATAGIIFMHYLFFESVFRIHAICPWCFVVWMITIPIFFSITIYNLRAGNIGTANNAGVKKIVDFVANKHTNDILLLWYFIISAILITKFWYYWSTLF